MSVLQPLSSKTLQFIVERSDFCDVSSQVGFLWRSFFVHMWNDSGARLDVQPTPLRRY